MSYRHTIALLTVLLLSQNAISTVSVSSSNCFFDCGGQALPLVQGAGYTTNCTVTVDSSKVYGLSAVNVSSVSIANCRILNYTYGIHLDSANETSIINNTLQSNHNGVMITSGSRNTVSANNFSGNNVAVLAQDSAAAVVEANNMDSQNFFGILAEYSQVNVTDNTITSTNGTAIKIVNSTQAFIYSNNATGNTMGLEIRNSNQSTIYSNQLCANTVWDAYQTTESTGNTATLNRCNTTQKFNDVNRIGCTLLCNGQQIENFMIQLFWGYNEVSFPVLQY
ncbi:MAG: right-handed parallel beta-helix repeat-containing protein [Candidatus Altiarchaeota archaeon]